MDFKALNEVEWEISFLGEIIDVKLGVRLTRDG